MFYQKYFHRGLQFGVSIMEKKNLWQHLGKEGQSDEIRPCPCVREKKKMKKTLLQGNKLQAIKWELRFSTRHEQQAWRKEPAGKFRM